MPSYSYKAKKDANHTVKGQLNASNEEEALEMIHQLGLIPVSLQEGDAAGSAGPIGPSKVKPREVYLFSKQLSSLIKSGLPLLKGLEVIGEQIKNGFFSKIVLDMSIGVKSGRSFSSCLVDHKEVFSPLFVAMVSAGEEMGRLKEMLQAIADHLKKQMDFTAKVRSAMVYPALMLMVGILTVIFILSFVMPKMSVIFLDSGQRLPVPTKIVMAVSHFFERFWVPVVLLIAVGIATFSRWQKTSQGAWAIGAFLLNTPFVRDLVLKADLARFTGTMRLLLESGLPIIRSIEMSTPTVHNPQLKLHLLTCAEDIAGGENFGNCLQRSSLIPPLMAQSISVGEESGSLHEALGDIASDYEAQIDEATKTITTVLEPLMILGVGMVVGLIVFAMLLPIFSMDIMAR